MDTDAEPDEVVADYDRLATNLDALAATPTVQAFEQEQRDRRRMGKAILAVIILAILGGYLLTAIVAKDVGRTAARQEVLDSTVASLVQANAVRETQGLPPIPIDLVVSELNNKGIVQAVTAAVLSQIESDPRFRGSDGLNGAPGTNGQAGSAGTNGVNGQPGAAGSTGTTGPKGEPGPAGVQGPEGAQGGQGVAGPPGPTCPEGTQLGDVLYADGQTGKACVTTGG